MSNYDERRETEEKLENCLLKQLKKDPKNIELVKAYSAYRTAYELENIRVILWDIKHLLVKGQ